MNPLFPDLSSKGINAMTIAARICIAIGTLSDAQKIEAKGWYYEANRLARLMGTLYGVSVNVAAAVISAVSPKTRWAHNVECAHAILSRRIDIAKRYAFGRNIDLAIAIRDGDILPEELTGPKRRAFYDNICCPYTSDMVTVDSWMHRFVPEWRKLTAHRYNIISEAVKIAAVREHCRPHELQSMAWVAMRGSNS